MSFKQIATDQTKYFIAYGTDGTRYVGKTPVGLQTESGQPNFIDAETELDAVVQAHTEGVSFQGYRELPTEGEFVEAGIWSYGDELVICRQSHTRTHFAPSETLALFTTYRDAGTDLEWIPAEKVEVGQTRTYNGVTYTVIQSHVTQEDWTPDATPSLWQAPEIEEPPVEEVLPYRAPIGSTNLYSIGEKCLWNGKVYESRINNNAWSPSGYPAGWKEVV